MSTNFGIVVATLRVGYQHDPDGDAEEFAILYKKLPNMGYEVVGVMDWTGARLLYETVDSWVNLDAIDWAVDLAVYHDRHLAVYNDRHANP